MEQDEPTADEISMAWTHAIEAEGIGGARSQTLLELKAIRDRKTTWIGKYENDLRFAVDNYIANINP